MNTPRMVLSATAGALLGIASCNNNAPVQKAGASNPANKSAQVTSNAAVGKMRITIGSKTFKASLEDNPSAAQLKSLLPLTITVAELNGNEKYCDLPTRLPTDATSPRTIRNGDLMLYGDRTQVLFYQSFETTYRYTRLGRIDDPSGLAAAHGTRDAAVSLE